MKNKKLLFLTILCIGLIPKITLAETYDGEYSIDYLLRNYNIVTLGQKDNDISKLQLKYYYYDDYIKNKTNGLSNISSIEGAILVNGNYTSVDNSIFASSSNNIKSYIAGTKEDNITTTSTLVTNSDYIDFKKLYSNVMSESKSLADNSAYDIEGAKIEISSPGNYTIKNTSLYWCNKDDFHFGSNYNSCINNTILIKNYDKNDKYILNYYNDVIFYLPNINIMEQNSSNVKSLKEYIESGEYSGNIIFNFPNARLISIGFFSSIYGIQYGLESNYSNPGFLGSIIAPNADVYLYENNKSYDNIYNYYGSFIANSIYSYDYFVQNNHESHVKIHKSNYTPAKKIIEDANNYLEEAKDYIDDYYNRDYSIKDLLENYSLVTLGHKSIDSKSKLLEYSNTPGSIKLFHITGPALISGDINGKVYSNEPDDFRTSLQKYDRTIFDLESNKVTESYIKGKTIIEVLNIKRNYPTKAFQSVIQPWDNMNNDNYKYVYQKNNLFLSDEQYKEMGLGDATAIVENFLNFDRLYDNVVAEQSAIDEGKEVKNGEDKVTHIPIGGNYVIEDINDINEIVFDNFDEEKDKLTIITIKNEGDISFPVISKDTGSYKGIVTNDYYGKTEATHLYEQDTFVQDPYHGNIIWNVPNATYIKLKENAPFAGHLIAPNADVDTPETHFAGCFIVNSIYGEGNTEAHFYPITVDLKCDCEGYHNLSEDMKKEFSKYRLNKLLGGDKTIIEKTILGDQAKYEEDQVTLEKVYNQCPSNNIQNPVVELLSNPKTYRNIGIIILLLGSIISYLIYNKKKIQTQK